MGFHNAGLQRSPLRSQGPCSYARTCGFGRSVGASSTKLVVPSWSLVVTPALESSNGAVAVWRVRKIFIGCQQAGPSQTLTSDGEGHEWQKRKLASAAQSLTGMMDGRPGMLGRIEMFIFPKAGHFLPGHRASRNRVRTNHFTFSLFYFFPSDEK